MIPVMGKSMERVLEKWSAMRNAAGEVEIEVTEWFQKLVEEAITRTVFGNNSYQDGKKILELQAQQMLYATESFQKVFIPGYRYKKLITPFFFPNGQAVLSCSRPWPLLKELFI